MTYLHKEILNRLLVSGRNDNLLKENKHNYLVSIMNKIVDFLRFKIICVNNTIWCFFVKKWSIFMCYFSVGYIMYISIMNMCMDVSYNHIKLKIVDLNIIKWFENDTKRNYIHSINKWAWTKMNVSPSITKNKKNR